MDLMTRDKVISLMNKTRAEEADIISYTKLVKKELNLDTTDALKKMINWAIDKKIKTEVIHVKRNGLTVNKITNLEDLISEERNNKI